MKFSSIILALFLLLLPGLVRGNNYEAGVELQLGIIPLFNVNDGTYTKGEPAPGVTVYAERSLFNRFFLGAEMGFMWIRSINADKPRFIMNPMVRLRLPVPLYKQLTMHLIAGFGGTVWTEDKKTDMGLGVDLSDTRGGFSLRIGLGFSCPLNGKTALWLHGGYFATNTVGDGVPVVMDTLV
ncbi:hypothetical protein KKF84_17500, partial [Myxococcota bacterium]|nr:hypothetical protein [Myxococcota bacterium]